MISCVDRLIDLLCFLGMENVSHFSCEMGANLFLKLHGRMEEVSCKFCMWGV